MSTYWSSQLIFLAQQTEAIPSGQIRRNGWSPALELVDEQSSQALPLSWCEMLGHRVSITFSALNCAEHFPSNHF